MTCVNKFAIARRLLRTVLVTVAVVLLSFF